VLPGIVVVEGGGRTYPDVGIAADTNPSIQPPGELLIQDEIIDGHKYTLSLRGLGALSNIVFRERMEVF
jgi:hypothetical protein